jgi:hypothetical protein
VVDENADFAVEALSPTFDWRHYDGVTWLRERWAKLP